MTEANPLGLPAQNRCQNCKIAPEKPYHWWMTRILGVPVFICKTCREKQKEDKNIVPDMTTAGALMVVNMEKETISWRTLQAWQHLINSAEVHRLKGAHEKRALELIEKKLCYDPAFLHHRNLSGL